MKRIVLILSLILIVILLISPFLLRYLYLQALLPKNPDGDEILFVITPGESVSGISKSLEERGVIKSDLAFQFLVKNLGIQTNIQAGDFRLSPAMSSREIAFTLTHGAIDLWVTIPEGWRKEEIAQKFVKEFGIDEKEFLELAREGYLFPDTYLIPRESTHQEIIDIMENNFNRRFDENLRNEAVARGFSIEKVLILASIIEREVKADEDRPLVSAILQNRLKTGMPLGADATVQYALGYQKEENSWWKKTLDKDDLSIDSFYNTRKFAGFPPGPICNPGLSSIKAVIFPQNTDYFYYLSDEEGKMHYAKTLQEHIKNIDNYL